MFIQEAVCWLDKFKEYWSLDKRILTVLLNVDNLTYSIQHIRLNWSFKLLTLKQTCVGNCTVTELHWTKRYMLIEQTCAMMN